MTAMGANRHPPKRASTLSLWKPRSSAPTCGDPHPGGGRPKVVDHLAEEGFIVKPIQILDAHMLVALLAETTRGVRRRDPVVACKQPSAPRRAR